MDYSSFTDRSRIVMKLANQEAQRLNHEWIGVEHVLLGLIKEGRGVAANVLKNLGVDLGMIRLESEKLVKSGPEMVTMGKLPQTPRLKKAIGYAMEEAQNMSHQYVGTEHILLGLLRDPEGLSAIILTNLGLKLEDVRSEVLALLGVIAEQSETVPVEAVISQAEATDLADELAALRQENEHLKREVMRMHAEYRTLWNMTNKIEGRRATSR